MNRVLNIIDRIYSSQYFTTCLIAAIVILVVLFLVVLIMGIIDNKKEEFKKKEVVENTDITFSEIKEEDKIKEDVTFEYPTITKNLEDFKNSLEKELNKNVDSLLPLEKSLKPYKVVSVSEIEDTVVLPTVTEETIERTLMIPKLDEKTISLYDQMKEDFKHNDSSEIDMPMLNSDGNNTLLKQNLFSAEK